MDISAQPRPLRPDELTQALDTLIEASPTQEEKQLLTFIRTLLDYVVWDCRHPAHSAPPATVHTLPHKT